MLRWCKTEKMSYPKLTLYLTSALLVTFIVLGEFSATNIIDRIGLSYVVLVPGAPTVLC